MQATIAAYLKGADAVIGRLLNTAIPMAQYDAIAWEAAILNHKADWHPPERFIAAFRDRVDMDGAIHALGGEDHWYSHCLRGRCHALARRHELAMESYRIAGERASGTEVNHLMLGRWAIFSYFLADCIHNLGSVVPRHLLKGRELLRSVRLCPYRAYHNRTRAVRAESQKNWRAANAAYVELAEFCKAEYATVSACYAKRAGFLLTQGDRQGALELLRASELAAQGAESMLLRSWCATSLAALYRIAGRVASAQGWMDTLNSLPMHPHGLECAKLRQAAIEKKYSQSQLVLL